MLIEMARQTIDELVAEARAGLVRVDPQEAWDAVGRGAALLDIRVVKPRRFVRERWNRRKALSAPTRECAASCRIRPA
jgi:hypothetical protein